MAEPQIVQVDDVSEFKDWGPVFASPACQSVSYAGPDWLQKWYANLSPEAMRRLAAGVEDYVLGGTPEADE